MIRPEDVFVRLLLSILIGLVWGLAKKDNLHELVGRISFMFTVAITAMAVTET